MTEKITTYFVESHIDIAATMIGLLYLYLEYRASIWMWLASIVMAIFFIYIFYSTQLYASMTIYIYFFIASIYGWIRWLQQNRDSATGEHIILRIEKNMIPIVAGAILASFVAILALLYFLSTNETIVWIGDSIATALNVVAIWMASRKWAEQWCLLVPANLISSVLLTIQGNYASATMFFVYFIVSIMGYYNWKRMADRKN